ncbi:MAG: hypothetical protein EOO90_13720 [Pedobacter sp.]|nr:MAG: hypothetical protein EOO90_13720 [Pedobacter sp.]
MKKWLIKYFSFTKGEYNALVVLIGLIALANVTPIVYELFFVKNEEMSELDKKTIEVLSAQELREDSPQVNNRYNKPNSKRFLFRFDPNKIGIREWIKLGLSDKQAQSIINYKNKGGKFYIPEDLQKMYAVSSDMYNRLLPYVDIGTIKKPNQENVNYGSRQIQKLIMVELNSADTLELDEIRGVGAAFARRIKKYRDRLGGFYKKEQLQEVYGIDSLKYLEIVAQVTIDISLLRKIDINTVDFEELRNHPYLKYKQINAIIQYRKQHGAYRSIDDLKKVLILDSQTIDQLTPYLQF